MNAQLEGTFQLIDGYDKKTVRTYRACTVADIRAMVTEPTREYWFIDKNRQVRRCRTNGALKTWKRDPQRFERSFMYGMYEHFRLTTQEMLETLVFEV
jgi:hypothetical protein